MGLHPLLGRLTVLYGPAPPPAPLNSPGAGRGRKECYPLVGAQHCNPRECEAVASWLASWLMLPTLLRSKSNPFAPLPF